MTRRIPRLEVIEAFIEAARAPSFRIAAERCALSPAAFSRRIQAFRLFVGREVFDRTPAGMRLTAAGHECLDTLEPIYRSMTQAALELGARRVAEKVTLSCPHSLAVAWLFPRLDRFREAHPGLDVTIQTERTAEAVRTGDADLGVCAQSVDASGLHTEHLLDIHIEPMAAPEVAGRFCGDLNRQRLFAPIHAPDIWSWWAGAVGVDWRPERDAQTFDMAYALYEAAASGWGLAPGMSATVAGHLKSGRLVSLGLPSAQYPGGYRLVGRASRMRAPAVAAMWRWMADEGRSERRARLLSPDPQRAAASSATITASAMR